MEAQVLEGEAEHRDDGLGGEAPARHLLVDPVAHVGVLERTPLDGVEVDLSPQALPHEDAEPVTRPQLAFAVPGPAAGGEGPAVVHHVGPARRHLGLPPGEPLVAAQTHLLPLLEVGRG